MHIKGYGVLAFGVDKGFRTDGRSGGWLVDRISPHYGNELTFISYLIHDVLFCAQDFLTFEFANELLDAMLEYAGLSRWRRKIVLIGVSTAIGRKAFDIEDEYDKTNKNLITFDWRDR